MKFGKKCPACNGTGAKMIKWDKEPGVDEIAIPCWTCRGGGRVILKEPVRLKKAKSKKNNWHGFKLPIQKKREKEKGDDVPIRDET